MALEASRQLLHHRRIERIGIPTVLSFLLIVMAAGCAGRQAPATRPEARRYAETGLASWYGKPFHGRRTASGERFDMHALTAAHRTLPFGSIVRVTDLESGRAVKVRINDRGPFRKDRIIDLSYAAARELGMLRRGVTRVGIDVLGR